MSFLKLLRKKKVNREPFWKHFKKINTGKGSKSRRQALRIAGIYMVLGILWILLSDKVLEAIVSDKQVRVLFSIIKGWLYVLATGAMLFGLTYPTLKRIKSDEKKIGDSYAELNTAYEELEAVHDEIAASEEELRQQFNALMESQERLSESEERYRIISEATNDAIWDEKDGTRYFTDRWYEITGYTREKLGRIGDWRSLIHPDDAENVKENINRHLRGEISYYNCEYRLKRSDGQYMWIQTRGKAILNETGNSYRMAGSHTDITELKEYQQRLKHMAYHDSLTGLPNRPALYEDLPEIFSKKDGICGALLFIDLDNFKFINDSMGHSFGDQLIKKTGERLVQVLEKTGMVYRLGGDEFVVLIRDYDRIDEINEHAQKILTGFGLPFVGGNSILHTTSSIGISLFPEHGEDPDELLRHAGIAIQKAKSAGKNRFEIFDQTMNEVVLERMAIENQLRTALEKNEFSIHYQPQLDLKTSRISGFEALLRWNNPELGAVPPMKFIKVAEDTHLIMDIGKWVLHNACCFIKKLQGEGYFDLIVSVNVSILQLLQDDFVDDVLDTLYRTELDPECLELEITESALMESFDMIGRKLMLLKRHGVRIALDDFGKGYSSLHYLQQLPITTLKVDKSFIDSINLNTKESSLTGQIVSIGTSMGLCVVAEGVETQEQMDYLIEHECHKIQGYYFSRPVPENEAEALLRIPEEDPEI